MTPEDALAMDTMPAMTVQDGRWVPETWGYRSPHEQARDGQRMKLDTLTLDQCERVRLWRNASDVLPMLRTREELTAEQQANFYRNVVCNPHSNHRYYALIHDELVGMGGLTYLDRTPGEGEISLILGPGFRLGGLGTLAVDALRTEAGRLGLTSIVGECYTENPACAFWVKMIIRCDASARFEPDRMFFRLSVLKGAA